MYFHADAGFANPEVYEFLEAERIKYEIRLPANRNLQDRIGYLLKRPPGDRRTRCVAFMPTSREECVQMLGSMTRSAPQSPFELPEVRAVVRATRLSCQNAGIA
jgi:hypothetical protein